jgi:hypothetical protein
MSRHTDLSIVPVSVAPSPATSGTTLGVTDANAALLPTVYPWWALVKPTGENPTRANSEILKVTDGSSATGTTTYTIERTKGIPVTTARTIIVGDDILEVHTAEKQIESDNTLDNVLADLEAQGSKYYFVANENQAFGDVCFINIDSEAQLGDADGIATAKVKYMCLQTVTTGNTAIYLKEGKVRNDAWNWTVGGENGDIFLSTTGTTGNTLTQTRPTGTDDCVVIIGTALTADIIDFKVSENIVERT